MLGADGHAPRRAAATALLVTIGAAILGGLAAPAAAVEDGPDAGGDLEQAVVGELVADGDPVEDVLVRVRRDGAEIGEERSGPDGRWRIRVPDAGVYEVEIVVETLPEGVELRDPETTVRDNVRVSAGREQRVRFPFGDAPDRPGRSGAARLVNTAWNGLKFGLVIALASVGLSLVFGTTGLVNFMHAELVTFGALAAWFFNSPTVGPQFTLVVAAALGVVASGALGAGLRAGLWRPLERRRIDLVSLMIISIGLGLALRYGFAVVYGSSPRTYQQYVAQPPWTWGSLVFPPKDLVIIPLCAAVLVVVALGLARTRLGTAIRAVSDDRDLAESSGIDVQRVVFAVWVLGAGLAGLGGAVFAMSQAVQWDMGFRMLLTLFAAVILGGLGSVYGPMVGGLVVGMTTELSTLWFSAEFKVAFALGALILVLLFRPQGVLGVRERVG